MTIATLKFWKLLLQHFRLHVAVRNHMQRDPHWFGDKWRNIEGAVSDLCGCAVNLKKTLTRVFFLFHCFLQLTHRENPVRIFMLNWEPLLRINYKRLTHYNYSTSSHEKAALVKYGKYGQPLQKKKKNAPNNKWLVSVQAVFYSVANNFSIIIIITIIGTI